MNWLIERKLRKIGEKTSPDKAYVSALQKTLQTQVGHPMWWVEWKKIAIVSLTSFSLIAGGTGVYAYSSDDVTPDHPLYALRQEIESVETSVAVTPEERTHVEQKHQQRRDHEQQVMEERKKEREMKQAQDHRQTRSRRSDGRLSERNDQE